MLTEPKTFLSESISAVDNFLSGKQNIQHLFEFVFVYIFQVRKSFFNDLNINNNVSIVDLLYHTKAELLQLNPTHFSSLGVFISKKV